MSLPARNPAWKWWVCGLLLLATTINYMDRLTLNLQAKTIKEAFGLDNRDYGLLEAAFGSAFALGAIVMGWLADRINVRLLYTLAVLLWSLAGLATGLVEGFAALLVCRFALGFAEAGNWPCALRTTQHILPPNQRTLGNSILQSGAAIGAIITPLLVLYMTPVHWRTTFVIVGLLGLGWAGAWLLSVRSSDLDVPRNATSLSLMSVFGWLVTLLVVDTAIHLACARYLTLPGGLSDTLAGIDGLPLASKAVSTVVGIVLVARWLFRATEGDDHLPRPLFLRRFVALATTVVAINITWHYFRAWLPLFLQEKHGYTEPETMWFSLYYYVATDIGSLVAGFLVLGLAATVLGVHGGRLVVYAGCTLLTLLSVLAAQLPAGGPLEATLLAIGFGALGLFPVYYSLSQELTRKNQGKLTGSLGCICWLSMSLLQEAVGDSVKRTGSYSVAITLAGIAPLIGLAALLLLWGKTPEPLTIPTNAGEPFDPVRPGRVDQPANAIQGPGQVAEPRG